MNAPHDPQDILEGYRQATQHTAATVNASLDESLGRISAGEQIPMPPPAPTSEIGLGLKLIVGAGVTGAIAFGALMASDRESASVDRPAPVAVEVREATTQIPTQPPPPPPRSKTEPASEPQPPASVDPPVPARSPERSKPETNTGSGLDEEIRLMGAARRALGAGDADGALRTLEVHQKRFPNGQLQADRERSMVTVLCQLGRTDDALRLAERTGAPLSSCPRPETP